LNEIIVCIEIGIYLNDENVILILILNLN